MRSSKSFFTVQGNQDVAVNITDTVLTGINVKVLGVEPDKRESGDF